MLYPAELRARIRHVPRGGAGNETRTRDPKHGKLVLYQLSYSRVVLWEGLEPSRLYSQRILSPLCLPIPPPKRDVTMLFSKSISL